MHPLNATAMLFLTLHIKPQPVLVHQPALAADPETVSVLSVHE
jgi:hypothetical protein